MLDIHIDRDALATACEGLDPAAGPAALIKAVKAATPGFDVRLTLTETDWYRLGGVVTAEGARIADNLDEWVVAEAGNDLIDFVARYGDLGYCATHIVGKTHFLTIPLGTGALDFVQIEVDEVQEVMDHLLLDPDVIPDTVEDVIDPLISKPVAPKPLNAPRYALRKVFEAFRHKDDLLSEYVTDTRFRRFLEDWIESSAGASARFCDHWVLKVVPSIDENGDHRYEVRLLSPDTPAFADFVVEKKSRKKAMVKSLGAVDEKAGYPMAWFFLALVYKYIPLHRVESYRKAVAKLAFDHLNFVKRDQRVMERWRVKPYQL